MRTLIAEYNGKSKNLSRQLIRVILGLYLTVATGVTCIQMYTEFKNEHSSLEKQISALALTFQQSVAEALWNYDDDQIQAALKGLYRNEEIIGVDISGLDKHYRIGLVQDEKSNRIAVDASTGAEVNLSSKGFYDVLYVNAFSLFSPENSEERLGSMHLYSSSITVLERTYSTLILTLISALIKTAALWINALYFIHKLIEKPISELKHSILNLNIAFDKPQDYQSPSKERIQQGNELFLLNECFLALCAELYKKNLIVNKHTAELESMVDERTQDLNNTLEKLVTANQVKSDFLANVSHELRTPLNSIIGFTRRICDVRKDTLDEKTLKQLTIVLKNGENLNELINDILDVSILSSGNLVLDLQQTSLNEIINNLLFFYKPLAKKKNIRLEYTNSFGDQVVADAKRIEQVLRNILNNALKFTDEGCISLSISPQEKDGKPGLCIEVSDTGMGISREDQVKIFTRFQQLGNAHQNTVKGTGLGMALVKELVDLHDGIVSLKSELGVGTSVCIWLPDLLGQGERQSDENRD